MAYSLDNPTCETPTIENEHTNQSNYLIGEPGDSGGYIIETDNLYYEVMADHGYKYSKFLSREQNRTIEYYASPTEMIIIDDINGEKTYCHKTFEQNDQQYTNPLRKLYNDIAGYDFKYLKNHTIKDSDYKIYSTSQTVDTTVDTIRYNKYSIELDWIDGQHYIFDYYEYANNNISFSESAPIELHDEEQIKNWVVDIPNSIITNSSLNTQIDIQIIGISTGEEQCDNDNLTTTSTHHIRLYVNTKTNAIDYIDYVQDEFNTTFAISHNAKITKPQITDEMVEMSDDRITTVITLIHMLESAI
jgi:hypothetical protein